jgi:hypothetical protein
MSEQCCPVWVSAWTGPKNAGGVRVRRECGKPATAYRVKGQSFTVIQILCKKHRRLAEKENFTLTPVEVPVETVQNS